MTTRVGIVGLGHIGLSVALGLSAIKHRYSVRGHDKNAAKVAAFEAATGFTGASDAGPVLDSSELVLLCVRSNQVCEWISGYRDTLDSRHGLICLAAGSLADQIEGHLREPRPEVYRAVTNINTANRAGMTVLLRPAQLHTRQMYTAVKGLLSDVGEVIEATTEANLNALSVMPGCAPAMVAVVLRSLQSFGVQSGFEETDARRVAMQCIAATVESLRAEGAEDLDGFMRKVAAPGGIVDRLLDSDHTRTIEEAIVNWFDVVLQHMRAKNKMLP